MSGSGGGATVLREFLVQISYAESGRKQFSDSMVVVANQAVELGKTMARAAKDVVDAVAQMTASLEDLYFQSQRTRATVESINALGFAASQMGSSVAGARGTIEAFGRFLRTNPGGENFLSGLGVATRDANGNLRETGDLLKQTIKVLNTKQPGVAMAYANVLGIDEKTLLGLTAEAEKFDAKSRAMYKAAGVDQQAAARDSHLLQVEFRTLGEAVTVLSTKFISLLAPRFTADVRRWREVIEQNFGPITRVLQWIADKVLLVVEVFTKLFVSATQIVAGIADAWGRLDPESKRLIGIFAAVALAWRLLNAAFMLSPWGVVIALGVAIVGLYNDYKVWEEHGRSLIDWGKWKGEIDAAIAGLHSLAAPFKELAGEVDKLILAIEHLVKSNGLDGLFNLDLIKRIETTAREMRGVIGYITDVVRLYTALAQGKILGEGGALSIAQEMKDKYLDTPEMKKNREETHQRQQQQYGGYGAGGAYAGESWLGGMWRRHAPRFLRGGAPDTAEMSMSPHARGLLDTIAGTESPGYDVMYGGSRFSDFSRHPNQGHTITSGPHAGEQSTAAGRYQFINSTWEEARAALNLPDFSPQSQDRAALWLAQREYKQRTGRDLDTDLQSSDPAVLAGIGTALRGRWTSLPGGIEAGTTSDRFVRDLQRNSARERERSPQLAERPAPLPALVPPPDPATTGSPGFLSWMRGRVPPATVPVPDTAVRVDPEYLRNRNAPVDDTTVKVDPEYLRNRNAPVTYPPPLLDSPPLGAPANTNINTSTVAPVINQTTNIHLTGGADQNRQVIEGQQSVNERLVRNVSSATR